MNREANDHTLPITASRRRRSSEEIEIIDRNDVEVKDNWTTKDEFKREVTLKALESLPQMLDIAQSIVDIQKMKENVNGQINLLREQGDYLQKEADKFVKEETARRATLREKTDSVQQLLRDLYQYLKESNSSDEVQKKMLDVFSNSIDSVLANESRQSTDG